ncbi:MAG: YbbR-like domain-containing protein [Planctomycetota bacterium]|jgi:hypothetical protein
MNDKLNKFLVVVFLTLLIWAWAYMSQETDQRFSGTLAVSPSIDPSRLVTITLSNANPKTNIPLTTLNLKGAPSRISDLSKRYYLPPSNPKKERLDFYYDPQDRSEGDYTLDLLEYLQKDGKLGDLAVTLESCLPSEATVTIEKLVEKELDVECLDKDGQPVPGSNPNPSRVKIYVRQNYPIESATVVLSPQLMETARNQPVEVTPYIDLGVAGVTREAASPILVTLQSEERLKPHTFQPTSHRFVMSPEIASRYEVELVDETFTGTTNFMATDEAMDEYKKMQYHVRIEIRDSDEQLSEIPPRPVIYNFPPEHFKNGDIDIVEVPVSKTATFKLIPLNPETN